MNIQSLYSFLYDNWLKIFPFRVIPNSLRHILYFGSYGKHCKVNILIFADKDIYPCGIVKIPLFGSHPFLENEYQVLNKLHEYPYLGITVPKVLYYDNWDENRILIESTVPGLSVKGMLKDNPGKILYKVVSQLTEFQAVYPRKTLCDENWYIRNVLDPMESLQRKTKIKKPNLTDKFARLAVRFQSIKYTSLPLLISHNDFRASNVFSTPEGSISVIDWEFSDQKGLPLMDLLYFAVDLIVETERTSYREAVNQAIRQTSILNKTIQKVIKLYCERLDIDEQILQDLYLLFGMKRALLSEKILFPLQSFEGIEWAEESMDILGDLIDWSENTIAPEMNASNIPTIFSNLPND